MNQDMLHHVKLTIEKIQQMTVTNPHPRVVFLVRTRHLLKKKSNFKSILKTHGEESDDENQDVIDLKDTDDDDEEEEEEEE
jgi:hypothetical protein